MKKGMAFLVVGGIAFLVDAGTLHLLVRGFTGVGPLFDYPLVAKIVAVVVATVVTYVGNRYWTFRSRNLPMSFGRYVAFILTNVIAIGLQLGCLAFSRYVLHLDGPIADQISGTLIGQVFATAFRYVAYDRWVFVDKTPPAS